MILWFPEAGAEMCLWGAGKGREETLVQGEEES